MRLCLVLALMVACSSADPKAEPSAGGAADGGAETPVPNPDDSAAPGPDSGMTAQDTAADTGTDSAWPLDTAAPFDTGFGDHPSDEDSGVVDTGPPPEPLPDPVLAPTIPGSVMTDPLGRGLINITVGPDTTGFMVTATGSTNIFIEEILDPSGAAVLRVGEWMGTLYNYTQALSSADNEVVLNWPIRPEDGPLVPGAWTVVVRALATTEVAIVDYQVQTKADPSFETGTVKVRLVFAEGVDEIEHVVAALDGAIVEWARIWALMGLAPDVRFDTSDLLRDVAAPGAGSAEIYSTSLASAEDELTIIFGETVTVGGSISPDILGVAGGIPGSILANTRSAMVVGWLNAAGSDGVFSDGEITVMGETLAHEAGHYMGLYHPVESSWATWDALSDTDDCTSETACYLELSDNLMFPFASCFSDDCVHSDQLSPMQQGVSHRYIGSL